MNGKVHVIIGMAAPTSAALWGSSLLDCLVLSSISAGLSLGPDIDHPNATATKVLGNRVHQNMRRLSKYTRNTLSTGRDKQSDAWRAEQGWDPEHRALTHTGIMAASVGTAVFLLSLLLTSFPTILALASTAVCSRLVPRIKVGRGRSPIVRYVLIIGVVVLALSNPVSPALAGFAAGVGWLSHIIADGCTKDGVPLLWPLAINGKKWWHLRILRGALTSGSRHEWWAAGVLAMIFALPVTQFLL